MKHRRGEELCPVRGDDPVPLLVRCPTAAPLDADEFVQIDGGPEAAEKFISRVWEPHLAEQRKAPKHPKSALQELAAAKECKPPVYEVIGRTGAHHAPKFTIRVSVGGLGEATAEGTSKQEAETEAAEALLAQLSPPLQGRGRGGE